MSSPAAGSCVLITGAASGLGRQLAVTLAGAGHAIAAIDLQDEGLARLAAELPRTATAVADVTDAAAMRAAANKLQAQLGPVELLIASAGVGIETSALDFCIEDFDTVVSVNLLGVAHSIAAVLPGMLERRRGHLVAISSLASFRGLPRMAGYCASKAGVNALLDSLRVELKPRGIAVTTICPGWIRTPMTAHLDVPMPGLLEVEDAARRIVAAIRQRRPFYAFPAASARRVRLLRWLPPTLSDWIMRRVLGSLQEQ